MEVRKVKNGWKVTPLSKRESHIVTLPSRVGRLTCDCSQLSVNGYACVHIRKVKEFIEGQGKKKSKTKKTYPQQWTSYNQAQKMEKLMFLDILSELCSFVPTDAKHGRGRPPADFGCMIFSMTAKVYEGLSSRRLSSDLEIAKKYGYIGNVPAFTTLLKYFGDERMTPILHQLIQLSALPLKDLERTFAVDSSGLTSSLYSRWFDVRFNKTDAIKDWLKIHCVIGTASKIVVNIVVDDGYSTDSPKFPYLVKSVKENGFQIENVVADKAYSSRNNLQLVHDLGGVAYIPFRSNVTGKARGSYIWSKAYHFFMLNRDEFKKIYHRRSLIECAFSMLKRKLSTSLFMKNTLAQTNEALAMILCHNIMCLISQICKSGLQLRFNEAAHKFELLNTKNRLLR